MFQWYSINTKILFRDGCIVRQYDAVLFDGTCEKRGESSLNGLFTETVVLHSKVPILLSRINLFSVRVSLLASQQMILAYCKSLRQTPSFSLSASG